MTTVASMHGALWWVTLVGDLVDLVELLLIINIEPRVICGNYFPSFL